jgi:NitT/TauT family transport system substrate-binding protein
MNRNANQCARREFLRGAVLAGALGLVGLQPEPALAEPPPETTRVRLVKIPSICKLGDLARRRTAEASDQR